MADIAGKEGQNKCWSKETQSWVIVHIFYLTTLKQCRWEGEPWLNSSISKHFLFVVSQVYIFGTFAFHKWNSHFFALIILTILKVKTLQCMFRIVIQIFYLEFLFWLQPFNCTLLEGWFLFYLVNFFTSFLLLLLHKLIP